MLYVLLDHFCVNDVEISYRIDIALVMDDGLIVKGSDHVVHAVYRRDMGQKCVSEPFAL